MTAARITHALVGVPYAQSRPRRGPKGGFYTPKHVETWRRIVKDGIEPFQYQLEGPVEVELIFLMPRPAGAFDKKGDLRKSAPEFHTQLPDIDNLAKAVLDSMCDANVFAHGDQQVIVLTARKMWRNDQTSFAGVTIWITYDKEATCG